jgi:hypothetical protein
MTAPEPNRLSTINLALLPVVLLISTPPIETGFKSKVGLR